MNNIKVDLILRKRSKHFFSIENVFVFIKQYLKAGLVELPYESKGIVNRFKNIQYLWQKDIQIIHITGHDHYLLWYPFKNTILTIHDLEALKRKKGIKYWIFKKLWFDLPISNAAVVTTISEFTKKELLTLKDYKTPIRVIPNPLTLAVQFEPKVDWSSSLKVLHIGTKANKNLKRTIEALKGIDCELSIIGKLNPEQEKALKEAQINYRNVSNLSEAEIIAEYRRCELLCFVSTYEGFGLPILEAQALGRVVLTSNLASMPEVAGEGAFLVDPFSVESIREGIERLIKENDLRKELIEKGRENLKRFEPKDIAKQYQALYKEVGES
jgi:glycosyltransferase involved in cell wall biosynthesis